MEELQDLHALTMKNQLGVDAETKTIMQGTIYLVDVQADHSHVEH